MLAVQPIRRAQPLAGVMLQLSETVTQYCINDVLKVIEVRALERRTLRYHVRAIIYIM